MTKRKSRSKNELPKDESNEWLDFFTSGKKLYNRFQEMARKLEETQQKYSKSNKNCQNLRAQNKMLNETVEQLKSKLSKIEQLFAELFPNQQKQSVTNNFFNQSSYNPKANNVNYD